MVDILSLKNENRIFKLVETIIKKGLRQKKKNRGDEPIQAIIHTYIYMEMSQENCMRSYHK
jgi:hypothetical protein